MSEPGDRKTTLSRFLFAGTAAWTAFFLTDLVAAHGLGAPLEYLAALRFTGTGIGVAAYAVVRSKKVTARTLDTVEGVIFPTAGLLVSLAAIPTGGITSPLALGVGMLTLTRALLLAPWQRAAPSALMTAASFPIVMTIAAAGPRIHAQMQTDALWTFILTTLFLLMGAVVSAGGSHLTYAARQEVQEARRLGAYRLVARIGSGGMGEVWLARQMPLDRPVALKLLKKKVLEEPGAIRRFKREALAASRLAHPHTIRVFDFGASDDGVFFLAMELLDGLDLEQIITRGGPIHPARAIHLARQICGSLAEAHHAGIVHCDMKPANVFVARIGDDLDFVKVLDFGLARVLVGPGATTVVESIRGTPAFMPPEIVRGERVGPESDVYAMGALLYYMVTGTTIFQGVGFHEMVIAQLEGKPDPPSKRLDVALPSDLEAVIMRCLEKSRGARFVTARELDDALGKCALAGRWSQEDARLAWEILRPSLSRVTKP
jgi:serine/threonine-protein kinase